MLIPLLIVQSLLLSFHSNHELKSLSKTITLPVIFEENEDYYVIALGIGNPRVYFPVQIDTSTTTTWVPSTNCHNCHSLSQYNSANSNTSKVQNNTYILSDEDGDIEGILTYDEIEVHSFIIPNFGFLQASKLLKNFSDHEDGKLGLGYHHELGHSMNFIEILKMKKMISERIFSIRELNYTHGELFIGATPVAKYSSCDLISTEDLDDEYKEGWVCKMSHIAFHNTKSNGPNDTKLEFDQAIEVNSFVSFDSAASYITAPMSIFTIFERAIFENYEGKCYKVDEDNTSFFRCDSSSHSKFNEGIELHFLLQGYSYIINLSELFEEVEENVFEFFIRFRNENDPIWNLGHPFMRKFQVIFNAEENHVGLIGLSHDFVKEYTKWSEKTSEFNWIWGISIISGLLLLFLGAFLIYWFTREKKHSLLNEEPNKIERNHDPSNINSDRNLK